MNRLIEDPAMVQRAAEVAPLLAVPARLRIARALLDGERNFDDLRVRADVPSAELLAHLNAMCQRGLLAWRHEYLHSRPHPRPQVLYGLSADAMHLIARGLASSFGPAPFTFTPGDRQACKTVEKC